MKLLVAHLLRQRHVIAEHHWWLNTNIPEDIAFIRETCDDYPDFFRVCDKPFDAHKTHGDNIWKFFKEFAEPETIYVRFDDDIVWMDDDAVEMLVERRRHEDQALLVMGNIVNNSICTSRHRSAGLLPDLRQPIGDDCCDPVGWKSPITARRVHRQFLADLASGDVDRWKEVQIPLRIGQRYSINVISWRGQDIASIPELYDDSIEEEPFLTQVLPKRNGKANVVCSDALFAHFAFWPQRPYLDWTSDDVLQQYASAAHGRPIQSLSNWGYLTRNISWWITKPARDVRYSLSQAARETTGGIAKACRLRHAAWDKIFHHGSPAIL